MFFQEVIQITAELLGCDPSTLSTDETGASSSAYSGASSSNAASSSSNNTASSSTRTAIKWKSGDRCLAPWNEDGKYVRNFEKLSLIYHIFILRNLFFSGIMSVLLTMFSTMEHVLLFLMVSNLLHYQLSE